jgi:hypothetical protein
MGRAGPSPNKTSEIVSSRVFILWFVFLYCRNTNLVLKYSVFDEMLQIYIYIMFSCVLHTANALTYFEHFSLKKNTNIQSLKENVFQHGFFKHKNYFIAF